MSHQDTYKSLNTYENTHETNPHEFAKEALNGKIEGGN